MKHFVKRSVGINNNLFNIVSNPLLMPCTWSSTAFSRSAAKWDLVYRPAPWTFLSLSWCWWWLVHRRQATCIYGMESYGLRTRARTFTRAHLTNIFRTIAGQNSKTNEGCLLYLINSWSIMYTYIISGSCSCHVALTQIYYKLL